MIRVGSTRGFTIIETSIFLAVSSILFVSAMLLLGGQQAKTEFRQSIGEVQSSVDDVANDVSTGYYTSNGNLQCSNLLGPSVSEASAQKGTNSYCIFLGRVVQFGTETNDNFSIYSLVGRRLDGTNTKSVTSLPDALATLVDTPGSYDNFPLPGGLTVAAAFYQDTPAGTKHTISGVAFTSTLASYTDNGLVSGTTGVNVVPITGTLGLDVAAFKDATDALLQTPDTPMNPEGGIAVCLDSGGTNQHVIFRIGTSGNLASTLTIKGGKSATDGECV